MPILTLWSICTCTGWGAGILGSWLRLGDISVRVLERVNVVVPRWLVKSDWEPPTELAGHVVCGDFFLLASLAVLDCLEAGLHCLRKHVLKVSDYCVS